MKKSVTPTHFFVTGVILLAVAAGLFYTRKYTSLNIAEEVLLPRVLNGAFTTSVIAFMAGIFIACRHPKAIEPRPFYKKAGRFGAVNIMLAVVLMNIAYAVQSYYIYQGHSFRLDPLVGFEYILASAFCILLGVIALVLAFANKVALSIEKIERAHN